MEGALAGAKRILSTTAAAAFLGIAFVATTGTASAYVVCNRYGDCWHSEHRYRYTPSLSVRIYPDHWYFHRDWAREPRRHWRGYREGRGYYRNGVWITF
jgi:hypothetical protein